jgi:hypothetical protein
MAWFVPVPPPVGALFAAAAAPGVKVVGCFALEDPVDASSLGGGRAAVPTPDALLASDLRGAPPTSDPTERSFDDLRAVPIMVEGGPAFDLSGGL